MLRICVRRESSFNDLVWVASVPFFDALGQVLAWDRSRDPAASWENDASFNVSSALAFVDHAFDKGTIWDIMTSLSATITSVVSKSALT